MGNNIQDVFNASQTIKADNINYTVNDAVKSTAFKLKSDINYKPENFSINNQDYSFDFVEVNDYNQNFKDSITTIENYRIDVANEFVEIVKKTGNTVISGGRSLIGGFAGGFLNIGEGVFDGVVYSIVTPITLSAAITGKVENKLNLENVPASNALSTLRKWGENIIQYDVSSKVSNFIIGEDNPTNISGVGNFVGEVAGYATLSKIPYAGVVVTSFGGAGKYVEADINKQIEQTGAVHGGTLFFKSFVGSVEGFTFGFGSSAASSVKKIGGTKTIAKGTNEMFSGGVKSGVKEFVKSIPTVIKDTGINIVKDPSTILQGISASGGEVYTKITGEEVSNNFSAKIFDDFGQAGIGWFGKFK